MPSISRRWIAIGALLAAIAVGLGAFAAHGLRDTLARAGFVADDLARRAAIFETAVRYQMFHAIALVLIGLALAERDSTLWRIAAWTFLAGIVIFCGLLKVLTFATPEWNWLGAVVPLGGLSMIAGWLLLAIGALRKP